MEKDVGLGAVVELSSPSWDVPGVCSPSWKSRPASASQSEKLLRALAKRILETSQGFVSRGWAGPVPHLGRALSLPSCEVAKWRASQLFSQDPTWKCLLFNKDAQNQGTSGLSLATPGPTVSP